MPTSLVSVVIPSYNHGRFLRHTIDSVLEGQNTALELIIIDDGSTDDSWQIISAAAAADERVRAYRQANQGAHAAINRGLALAQGEFLTILNSDDCYAPDRLGALVTLAQFQQLDFVATGLELIDGKGDAILDDPWLAEYQRMVQRTAQDGLWAALLERNVTVSTSNFFIRRALYEQLGPIRPYRYNMDWDYVLRAYLANPEKFAWRYDLPLWQYRLHGDNTILGGLPVSAIEANHLLLRSLQQQYELPPAALAGLRRHYKLIRQQQVAHVAAQRDAQWEAELNKAHAGWNATAAAHDATHEQLGALTTAHGHLQHEHGTLAHEHALLQQTQQQLLNSRSYRWGRKLTAPLRWAKQHLRPRQTTPVAAEPLVAEPVPVPDYRIAVHVHLYYEDLLDELLDAVANVPQADVFISTPHDIAPIAAAVQARLPQAVVWQCPNQGKDVGPFIDAIRRFDLPSYDLVLKLHSKKSQNAASYMAVIRQLFGDDIVDGDDWRQKLIAPLAGSPAQVQRVLQHFAAQPQIGMIGAAPFLCTAPDADTNAYAALCERLRIATEPLFFGGTMFWLRGAVLQRFIDADFSLHDFDPAQQGAVENTLEHQLERVFGALVQAEGLKVQGIRYSDGES